jgi:diguanylate cyclase (GGDEF)-like protein
MGVRPAAVPRGERDVPPSGSLERVSTFGPFDVLSEWAHRLYIDGFCEEAVDACRAALLVVEPAGDVTTTRYLRYVEGIALQEMGHHRQAMSVAFDLANGLDGEQDPCWRAKALALLAEASVGAGELNRALDALAEGRALVAAVGPGSYQHLSASMAVALAMRAVYLFEQADRLLVVAHREADPHVELLVLHEATLLRATWAATLELVGHAGEATAHHERCAARARRMRRVALATGDTDLAARAEVFEAYALSRLGSTELAAAWVLAARDRFEERPELVETQLGHLVLGAWECGRGRFEAAREHLLTAAAQAERTGREVWSGTVLEALAEVDVAEHGRHPGIGHWRRLAREALQRMWREREARFAALEDRHRIRELSAETLRIGRDVLVDPLTGLGNRRMLAQTAERVGSELSVVFMDVDRFKQVNDVFSHAVGDEVLLRLAVILRQQCRSEDVVIRYGGDEFVVLVLGDTDAAHGIARRLHEAVRTARWDDLAAGLHVTVSLGVARAEAVTSAMATADGALFVAKRSGRDRVVVA